MSLMIHQFKKDVRHFRLLLIIWFLLIALQSVLSASGGGAAFDDMRMQIVFSMIAFLVPLLQVVLLIVAIPLLVQDEPLVGSTAFWFTRPISRKTLLGTKTFFITTLLLLPPVLAEIIVLACNGITAYDIMLAVPEIVMEKLSFMLPLLLLASLTQSFGRFALVGGIIFVSVMLFTYLLFIVRMYTGEMIGGDISLAESRSVVGGIVTILCGIGLLTHQYLTRKTIRTIIAAIVVFMIVMGIEHLWTWDFLKARSVSLDKSILKGQELKLVAQTDNLWIHDDFKVARHAERYKTIRGEVSVLGEPPGHFVEIKELKSIKLKFPDGVTIESAPRRRWQHSYSGNRIDALQHVLGKATLVNKETRTFSSIELMSVKESDYAKYKTKNGVYSAEATCALYEYDVIAALALKKGERYDKGSEHVAIIDVLHETAGCTVVLRESSVDMLFDRKRENRRPSRMFMYDNVKKLYVLRNKKQGEAFLPEEDMGTAFDLTQQKRLVANTLRLHYTSINDQGLILPEINEAWLADADLLRIEALRVGDFSRPLRVETFSLKEGSISRGSSRKGLD